MLQKIKEILIKLPDLALLSTLIGSNYPFLELIFMVPEVFEPLKFDCNNNNHDNYDNNKKIMRTSVSESCTKANGEIKVCVDGATTSPQQLVYSY